MEEVNYLDQVRLVAVDHPAATEVYPNERFLNQAPFADGRAVLSENAHPVAAAWDDKGREVSALLRTRDHQYVRDLPTCPSPALPTSTRSRSTWANGRRQSAAAVVARLYRVFFGEFHVCRVAVEPQASAAHVEAQLPDGSWKRVIDEMGFPAGLPRTIVVDLTGKLPPGTRRIRLTTNLQIYWDQALVDNGADAPQHVRQTELPLASAQLAFRGYPEQIDGKTPGDLTYNYQPSARPGLLPALGAAIPAMERSRPC